jgi:hypothetical protein
VRAAFALLCQRGTRRGQRAPGRRRWVSWPPRYCVWNPTARSPTTQEGPVVIHGQHRWTQRHSRWSSSSRSIGASWELPDTILVSHEAMLEGFMQIGSVIHTHTASLTSYQNYYHGEAALLRKMVAATSGKCLPCHGRRHEAHPRGCKGSSNSCDHKEEPARASDHRDPNMVEPVVSLPWSLWATAPSPAQHLRHSSTAATTKKNHTKDDHTIRCNARANFLVPAYKTKYKKEIFIF